jgi:hypothetical protein
MEYVTYHVMDGLSDAMVMSYNKLACCDWDFIRMNLSNDLNCFIGHLAVAQNYHGIFSDERHEWTIGPYMIPSIILTTGGSVVERW